MKFVDIRMVIQYSEVSQIQGMLRFRIRILAAKRGEKIKRASIGLGSGSDTVRSGAFLVTREPLSGLSFCPATESLKYKEVRKMETSGVSNERVIPEVKDHCPPMTAKEKSSSEIVYHSQAKLEILANLLSHYDSGFGLDKYGVYGLTHILSAIQEDLKECVECERHESYLNEYQDQILDSMEKMDKLILSNKFIYGIGAILVAFLHFFLNYVVFF